MDPKDIRAGMAVRLRGPAEHRLHRATGTVVGVLSPDEMWHSDPLGMLSAPFAWPDGQVLVALDAARPRDPDGRPWIPRVAVAPVDLEDPEAPIPPAREKMREIVASWGRANKAYTRTSLRAQLAEAGFEVDRRTLHAWLTQDAPRRPEAR